MDTLKILFPDRDAAFLRQVYIRCGQKVEVAADFIVGGEELPSEDSESDDILSHNDLPSPPVVEEKGEFQTLPEKPRRTLSSSRKREEENFICDNLKRAIDSALFSDVHLISSDGKKIFAHEVILTARSPFLTAYLQSLPENDGIKVLEVEGVSHKMLIYLLQYLYTDDVEFPSDDAHDLLCTADLMDLPRLRRKCELGSDSEPSTFGEDLLKALNEPSYRPDVTLVVQDKKILSHKLILSAGCEYFQAMFGGTMAESHKSEILIPDTNYDLFYVLLQVLYSNGTLARRCLTSENAIDLFLLSNRFIVHSLQRVCEDFIKESLDIENVCQILELTGNLSRSLKFMCQQFIYGNYEVIKETEHYKKLNPILATEMSHSYETFKNETVRSFMSQVSTEELADYMKTRFVKFLGDNVNGFSIKESISSEAETPIGRIKYSLSNFELTPPSNRQIVRNKDVTVQFSTEILEVGIFVHDLSLQMPGVYWEYQQQSRPYLQDSGSVWVYLEGITLDILLSIVPHQIGIPQLQLKQLILGIRNFRLELKDGKYSWLYRIIFELFQNNIKNRIEEEFGAQLREALTQLTNSLNSMGTSDYEEKD